MVLFRIQECNECHPDIMKDGNKHRQGTVLVFQGPFNGGRKSQPRKRATLDRTGYREKQEIG